MPLKRNWILAALMLTMMLAAMDITIVSTAIPQIVSDLGGFSKFSWVFSIYLLAQTVTIPVYGKLADIFGRKVILITGICIFLLGSATSAMSWDIFSLIAFRGIQGLGAGSIMATVNTIAGDIYSIEERAKIQGWLSSIWGVSAIAGPVLGGALTAYVSWRWIFLVNIPVGIISILFLLIFFKEKVIAKQSKIDYKGSALILITLGLLIIYLLETGQSWALISIPGLLTPLIIVVLGILIYFVERKAPDPVMPAWLWRNKTFAFTSFAMVGMGIIMMGPETFLPTFAQASLGMGIIASGFVLASMSIGWPTASALSGRIYLKIGFRNTSLIGTCFIAVACAGFLFIPWPQPVWLVVADQIILGAGFGLLSTPSMVGVQSMVEWNRRGVVTSAIIFSRNLGQSLGAAIFGAIFNSSIAHQLASAPQHLSVDTNTLLRTIQKPGVSEQARLFLSEAISTATRHIYMGLTVFAIITLACIMLIPDHGKPERNKRPMEN